MIDEGAIVPALWRLEVANSLTVAVRRERIDVEFRRAAPRRSGHLYGRAYRRPRLERHVASGRPLPTPTLRRGLYGTRARRMLPLATLDHKLRAAARAVGTKTLAESPATHMARRGSFGKKVEIFT